MTDDKRYILRETVSKLDLDAGYLDYLRSRAAVELFRVVSDGQHYTVRVIQTVEDAQNDVVAIDPIFRPQTYEEHRQYQRDNKTVTVTFEVCAVQSHHLVMVEPPDYGKMDWSFLSVSAVDEIKRRLRSKWRWLWRTTP